MLYTLVVSGVGFLTNHAGLCGDVGQVRLFSQRARFKNTRTYLNSCHPYIILKCILYIMCVCVCFLDDCPEKITDKVRRILLLYVSVFNCVVCTAELAQSFIRAAAAADDNNNNIRFNIHNPVRASRPAVMRSKR